MLLKLWIIVDDGAPFDALKETAVKLWGMLFG